MAAQHVTMRVGEEHEIRLSGLATAGYQWRWDVEGDREAIEVTKSWGSHSGHGESVGTSADEIFTVAARRPGRAQLRLEQRRRWEKGGAPNERLVVVIEVQG